MAFLYKLVYSIAILSLARALPTKSPQSYENEEIQDSYNPQSFTEQSTYEAFALPTNLQLPKTESAQIPFYVPDLSTALKAPQYSEEPNYYQVPVPAQDLVAPSEQAWNPDNDPAYFYELPAAITKQNTPTNFYPKKFNKDIHVKSKPLSNKPKQVVVLKPIDEKEFVAKQKALSKVYDSLAKKENQKDIQVQPFGAQSRFDAQFQPQNEHFEQLAHSSSSSSAPHGERHEFHMTGHDGPHSYKWGFDTGTGHNRQFRYEERDKEGIVKGHFGFYDKHGKLQMVNYDAHPHDGYHADGNFGKF